MPAGRGSRCEACYWSKLLGKRIVINTAAFKVDAMARQFEQFGEWLGVHVGVSKAAITIQRYLPFFLEIERRWKQIPDYQALLDHFGASGLRKALLPMRWFEQCCGVQPDPAAKRRDAEQRRIDAMLRKIPAGLPAEALLRRYSEHLLGRLSEGKSSLSSVRLALFPALALIENASSLKVFPPDQHAIEVYLQQVPGQRAAVTGFVNFLRETCGIAVVMPKTTAASREQQRKRRLEKRLQELIAQYGQSDEFQRHWISWALEYFHRVKAPEGAGNAVVSVAEFDDEGATLEARGLTFWIPRWKMGIETQNQI